MDALTLDPPVESVSDAHLLHEMLSLYLGDAKRRGVTDTTLANYEITLRYFFDWLGERTTIERSDLEEYARWLGRQTNHRGGTFSKYTVFSYTKRTRHFLSWVHRTGRSPVDIGQWIDVPSRPKPKRRILDSDELYTLITSIYGPYRLRNMAIIALLVETGCRRTEAAHITWDSVHFHGDWKGHIDLPVVKGYLDVDKSRTVVFGEASSKLLQMYYTIHPPRKHQKTLFNITGSGIGQMLGALSRHTGIALGAHDFRKTFATYWIKHCETPNQSLAERLLELQLGHSPSSITQRHYLALGWEDIVQCYVSPLDAVPLPGITVPIGVD